MAFSVPAPASSDPENRFEFSIPGHDELWSVPKYEYLPVKTAMQLVGKRKTSEILAALFGDDESDPMLAAVLTLTPDQITALLEAWREASGISLGESSASSNS